MKVNFSLFIICYLFQNEFYARKSSKVFWSFQEIFTWFSGIKIFFKVIPKVKGKTSLHKKGTLKGISKRHLYSYKTLKNSIKIWKKLNFLQDIANLSHIYQLSLTYFRHFEAYFVFIFLKLLLLDPSPMKIKMSHLPHTKQHGISLHFFAFTKSSHLKWEENLKIDKLIIISSKVTSLSFKDTRNITDNFFHSHHGFFLLFSLFLV